MAISAAAPRSKRRLNQQTGVGTSSGEFPFSSDLISARGSKEHGGGRGKESAFGTWRSLPP